ncbi:MAG: PilZ domain-containing protein [Alphaproteobacteria bacterium]|nr:PilZ domain-containing protein [Alphaproteobacteria bacterium]
MPATMTAARPFGRRHSRPKTLFPTSVGEAIARAPRKEVRLPAALTAEHLHGTMPCAVANISSTGALLRLPFDLSASNIWLPEMVRLRLLNDRREVDCRVVYQDGLKVGVCFLAPFSAMSRA